MGTDKGLQSGSVNGGGLKSSCGESVDRFVLPEPFLPVWFLARWPQVGQLVESVSIQLLHYQCTLNKFKMHVWDRGYIFIQCFVVGVKKVEMGYDLLSRQRQYVHAKSLVCCAIGHCAEMVLCLKLKIFVRLRR